jgi:hypothetical protein
MTARTRAGWLRIAAMAAVLVAAMAWLSHRERARTDAAWTRLRTTAERVAREIPRGTLPHAPLLGEAREGEATAHYARALDLLEAAIPDREEHWLFAGLDERPAEALPDATMRALGPVLEALAAGASSSSIAAPTIEELAGGALRPPMPVYRTMCAAIRDAILGGAICRGPSP